MRDHRALLGALRLGRVVQRTHAEGVLKSQIQKKDLGFLLGPMTKEGHRKA